MCIFFGEMSAQIFYFLFGLFVFFLLSCKIVIYSGCKFLVRHIICRLFFPSLWTVSSIFLMVPFKAQKKIILMKSRLPVFSFVDYAFGSYLKTPPNSRSQRFSPKTYHLGIVSILS